VARCGIIKLKKTRKSHDGKTSLLFQPELPTPVKHVCVTFVSDTFNTLDISLMPDALAVISMISPSIPGLEPV